MVNRGCDAANPVVILFVVKEGRQEVGMQVLKSFMRKRLYI